MRGSARSSAKRVSPVTFAQASTLGSRWPTTESGRSRRLAHRRGSRRRGQSGRRRAPPRRGSSCTRCSGRGSRPGRPGSPSRSGRGVASSRARAVSRIPGVQYPHCAAPSSAKACWSGWSRLPSGEALHGQDRRVLALDREGQAGEDRLAVDQHGAGPALPQLAAVLGPGEPEVLAQHLEERPVHRDGDLAALPVDGQGHEAPHRSPSGSDDSGWMKPILIHTESRGRVSTPGHGTCELRARGPTQRSQIQDLGGWE